MPQPSGYTASGISLDQGSIPHPTRWQENSSPLDHQGSSTTWFLLQNSSVSWLLPYYFFRAVPQSYLRGCPLGLESAAIHQIKHNSQLCIFFFFSVYRPTREVEEDLKWGAGSMSSAFWWRRTVSLSWLHCWFNVVCVAMWSTVPTVGRWRPLAHQLVHAEIACESNNYPMQIRSKKGRGKF